LRYWDSLGEFLESLGIPRLSRRSIYQHVSKWVQWKFIRFVFWMNWFARSAWCALLHIDTLFKRRTEACYVFIRYSVIGLYCILYDIKLVVVIFFMFVSIRCSWCGVEVYWMNSFVNCIKVGIMDSFDPSILSRWYNAFYFSVLENDALFIF
jgi:hypothetical protein